MTTLAADQRPAGIVGRPFYLILSLLMAAVFVAGFSTTVPDDFAPAPAPGLPLLLHLHGAVFTCWVLLFVAQPAFIARRAVKLHRQIGWLGAGLAGAMVVMGIAATLFAVRFHRVPSFFPPGIFLVMNILGIVVFGGLVAAGIAQRRNAEWHKRLMVCATVSILGPGLGRLLPMESFGAAAPLVMFGVILLFAFSGPAVDLFVRRRIHPAYFWGVGAIVLTNLVIPLLGFAPPTLAIVQALRLQ